MNNSKRESSLPYLGRGTDDLGGGRAQTCAEEKENKEILNAIPGERKVMEVAMTLLKKQGGTACGRREDIMRLRFMKRSAQETRGRDQSDSKGF